MEGLKFVTKAATRVSYINRSARREDVSASKISISILEFSKQYGFQKLAPDLQSASVTGTPNSLGRREQFWKSQTCWQWNINRMVAQHKKSRRIESTPLHFITGKSTKSWNWYLLMACEMTKTVMSHLSPSCSRFSYIQTNFCWKLSTWSSYCKVFPLFCLPCVASGDQDMNILF